MNKLIRDFECRAVAAIVTVFCLLGMASSAWAQGVTTGSLRGVVVNEQQQPVAGASVVAIHTPSGTNYETTTNAEGRYVILGMRVGGPYAVTVSYSGTGNAFEPKVQEGVEVNLGVATDLNLTVTAIAVQEAVTVTAVSDTVFASTRTGASTTVSRQEIATLPNLSNRLENFTRMTPQASGMNMAGQDSRMNNITVDGSYFNNSFGLGNTPGDRTGVAPISPQAIEQIQVNVAPYDVRQGNFVGAGINTITRSGTNQFRGSIYRQFRNQDQVGTEAKDLAVNPGTFEFANWGAWGAGPIVPNKLFFFGNFEDESFTSPSTTFRANNGGETAAGGVTRVLKTDMDTLSAFLQSKYSYDTGSYEPIDFETPARRYLAKGDYNLSANHKVNFRYTQLDSSTDVLVSNSTSLGFGNRRTNTQALSFNASNYTILEDIKSGIGEWNGVFGTSMANSLIIGHTYQDESRGAIGNLFPFVDILNNDNTVYTSFGSELFTPNNELRYKTTQVQNSFTKFTTKHTWTFGGSYEHYESENVFFPGSQSIYTYNSLQDFYDDANRVRPVNVRRFQVRWSNIPGQEKPVQPLEVDYFGAYAQDEWAVSNDLKLTYGLRLDVPFFGETGYENAVADSLTFRSYDGSPVQFQTAKLPDANVLWSPRVGFNWNLGTERETQVRGGTGVFTGRPAYVWISNQVGNTGVLTGFEQIDNTLARPFSPNPDTYKPTNVTGAPASSFELSLTEPGFKFPQIWRTNVGVDRRLPWGITGTAEYIYSKDVNGMYYYNANLPAAQSAFAGADGRPRWTSNRIHSAVQNAVVLGNASDGAAWNLAFSGTKNFRGGFIRSAYSYGESKREIDAGSVAFGSWNGNQHYGDPNNPATGYSFGSPGHRFYIAGSYSKEYFGFGNTTFSMFFETRTIGNNSYVFSGDLNGDGGTANDLLYIHRDASEMNFQTFTHTNGRVFTAAEQAAAWNTYIEQDDYLSKHRGEYAQRGAVFLPMVTRLDFSIAQDLFTSLKSRRHEFQFRVDMLNFGNLLSSNWGVSQRLINTSPLIVPSAAQGGVVDPQGRAQYRLRVINNELMSRSYEQTADLNDVWRIQFSLRYTFN
jgi:outer membrane receptor protein involved in Fe transport